MAGMDEKIQRLLILKNHLSAEKADFLSAFFICCQNAVLLLIYACQSQTCGENLCLYQLIFIQTTI